MSTDSATKYTFDTEFSTDGRILRDGEKHRIHFTREEMKIERDKAFEKGQQAALVKAEEQSAISLKVLSEKSIHIISTLKNHSNEYRAQAIDLVLLAARKIAGAALERYPEEQIQGVVGDVLKDLRDVPRLIITCPAEITDAARENLHELAKNNDFEGTLIIRCAEDAQPGDIQLEWAQGEVSVNTADVAERVENTVRHWLAATEAQEERHNISATERGTEKGN